MGADFLTAESRGESFSRGKRLMAALSAAFLLAGESRTMGPDGLFSLDFRWGGEGRRRGWGGGLGGFWGFGGGF